MHSGEKHLWKYKTMNSRQILTPKIGLYDYVRLPLS
jgi:hypothetical protein